MADPGDQHVGRMFPLTTKQFSATFLDFQRNSHGYNDKVESADQDVTKKLLNPFLPDFEVFSIPQCHHFGKAMWAFAKERTAIQPHSTNQSTDLTVPPCRFNSEGDLHVTPSKVHKLPLSSELPLFASKSEPTNASCNKPELNEQPNVEELSIEPSKRDFTNTAAWNGASQIRTTSYGPDQNQNTVISNFSISQNSDFHFLDCLQQQSSSSCKELLNEAHMDNKLGTSGAVSNKSSSHFENYVELADMEPRITTSTDCHTQNGYEKKVDIHGGSESKHSDLLSDDEKCMKTKKNVKTEECVSSVLEHKDVTKGKKCDATISENSEKQTSVMLNESPHKERHIMPLPLYKKGNHGNIPISKSLTVNLNLGALLSVLHSEKKTVKYAEHDSSIYGKVAVLYGFQQNTSVSVLQAGVVGWYDYISGTVNGLQQDLCHDNSGSQDVKSPFSSSLVNLDLDASLSHFHHISRALTPQTADGGNRLKEHSAVAWLLTSPALGVTLDWQVQEKFHKFVEILSTGEHSAQQQSTVSNNDCFSNQWFNLLVIIDEFRFVEKDIPLVEVYELCTSRDINLVNFDLN